MQTAHSLASSNPSSPAAGVRQDPLFWFSRRLQAALNRPASPIPGASLNAVDTLLDIGDELQTVRRRYDLATRRGWMLAAKQLARRIPTLVDRLASGTAPAIAALARQPQRMTATLGDLHQELLALETEFGNLQLDRRQGQISVVTERIVLEDVDVGRFRIELALAGLADDRNIAGAFSCVAMDPNPPSCSSSTTHPHVRDDRPCLGEAAAGVSAALRDGRLLDAFLAVASVLRTYNPGSPYVELADWYGESCSDCGQSVSPDDLHSCEGCDCNYCDGCSSFCDACNGGFCLGCLERAEDDENLCSSCRGRCDDCRAVARRSTLRDNGGRCDSCAQSEQDTETETPDSEHIEPVVAAAVIEGGGLMPASMIYAELA